MYERFLRATLMIPFVLIIVAIITLLGLIIIKDNFPCIILLLEVVVLAYTLFLTITVIPHKIWTKWEIHLFTKSNIRHRQLNNPRGYYAPCLPVFIIKSFLYIVGGLNLFLYFINGNHNRDFLGILMCISTITCFVGYGFAGMILESTKLKNKMDRRDVLID